MLDLHSYDFDLPAELIAEKPISPRDHSRLLVLPRNATPPIHSRFDHLIEFLRPGDTLVLNETKVFPARLQAKDSKSRTFEVFLLGQRSAPHLWNCLIRPGKKIPAEGGQLFFGDKAATVCRGNSDPRTFELSFPPMEQKEMELWLGGYGNIPLPPYIKREPRPSDLSDYQTVYAKHWGSVAAPTAGLHFTETLLTELKQNQIYLDTLTLHVGYGTFAPLDPAVTELHPEHFSIEKETYKRLEERRQAGGRIIAVGTTTLRALESTANGSLEGETRLFIRPGYRFRKVDGLITNFHLPQSSLFVLVCAFAGTDRVRRCYQEAIESKYRFFSYGDAMILL